MAAIGTTSSTTGAGGGLRDLFSRRAVLGLALAAGGGALAWIRARGYDLPAQVSVTFLGPASYRLFEAAAARLCARDADDAPSIDDVGLMRFVDGYIGNMHPALRRDLLRLATYLEQVAPLRLGYASRFTRLGPADQDRVLAALETADEGLLRGGFEGLKSLVFMGYYRHPLTWKLAGYGGPWVMSASTGAFDAAPGSSP